MPYIAGGQVLESRSPWSLSFATDFIWGIINFLVLFFQTLLNPGKASKDGSNSSDYRRPGGGGGGRGTGNRRMGGFGGRNGAPPAPPMAGGG